MNEHANTLTDTQALDAITTLLSGSEWSADTAPAVAEIVVMTGRTILDIDDVEETEITVRCPDSTHMAAPYSGPLYVVGCGHTFTATPDREGLMDCPHCGIWFKSTDPEAITS